MANGSRLYECLNQIHPQALRRVLLKLTEDPSQLQAMRLEAPEVPTIEAQTGIVRQLYVQAITTKQAVA